MERLKELAGYDRPESLSESKLEADFLEFADPIADLESCNVYIVTVPTPINLHKQPNLNP